MPGTDTLKGFEYLKEYYGKDSRLKVTIPHSVTTRIEEWSLTLLTNR